MSSIEALTASVKWASVPPWSSTTQSGKWSEMMVRLKMVLPRS